MKRTVALLLTLMLLVALLPISFSTADTVGDFEVSFSEDMDEVTIWDYHGEGGEVTVPSELFGASVTAIASYAFYDSNITKLTIPSSVKVVGTHVFYNCEALETLVLGAQTMLPIDYESGLLGSFHNCNALKEITVDGDNPYYKDVDGVLFTKDGKELLFYPNGREAESYTVPEGVEKVTEGAFWYSQYLREFEISGVAVLYALFRQCPNLEKVTIGDGVLQLFNLMVDCPKATTIILGSDVEAISYGSLFSECPALSTIEVAEGNEHFKTVDGVLFTVDGKALLEHPAGKNAESYTVPDGVETICDSAFSDNTTLKSIELPDTVTSIGDSAFYNCSALENIELPSGLLTIGSVAFRGCDALSEIVIPNSVTKVGSGSFDNCASLEKLVIGEAAQLDMRVVILFDGCDLLSTIEVAEGNPNYKVTDGVLFTVDGKRLLRYPPNLAGESYIVPEGTESLSEWAFCDNKHITQVVLSDSVRSAPSTAFSGCESLSSLSFGSGLSGFAMVQYLPNLTTITVSEDNLYYKAVDGVLFTKDGKTLVSYPKGRAIKSYTVPDGTETIGAYAFSDCNNLIEIEMGDSVETISSCAFESCKNLARITIGNGVTSIGHSTFRDCAALESLELPDGVEFLGEGIITGCDKLTTIEIPKEMDTSMGSGLGRAKNLTSITVAEGNSKYVSVDGVLITSDGYLVQYPQNKEGTSYVVPDGVTKIGSRAFNYCDKLEEITLPKSIEEVYTDCFGGCTQLKKLTFLGAPPDWAVSGPGPELYYYSAYESLWTPYGAPTWRGLKLNAMHTPFFPFETSDGEWLHQYPQTDEVGKIICNVPPRTTEAELLNVLNADGGSEAFVKTGDTLSVGETEYTVVVAGDLDGNGDADSLDAAIILRAVVQIIELQDLQKLAASTLGEETFSAADAAQILRYTVKLQPTVGKTE
ncbi:MAG: leucine-rich repeat protein [Clostridia bacterium]|nr:leucine-rich repeat protein [Clostridia bacterium]